MDSALGMVKGLSSRIQEVEMVASREDKAVERASAVAGDPARRVWFASLYKVRGHCSGGLRDCIGAVITLIIFGTSGALRVAFP